MSEAYENSLLKNDRDFYRQMARVGIPVMVQQLILVAVGICDTIMVGKLSEEALASVGAANQIFFVYIDCVFGFLSGVAVFSVQYWGIRDLKALRRLLGIAYSMCIAVGVPLTIISYAFAPQLIALFSDDPTVVAMGTDYLRIVVFTYLFTALTFVISYNSRAVAMLKWPTIANAVAVGLNIFLNWVLIFGKFGAPAMGVTGAATATLISRIFEAIMTFSYVYIFSKEHPLKARIREMKYDKELFQRVMRTALPVIFNELLWVLSFTLTYAIYGDLGPVALAVVQIAMTVTDAFQAVFAGISNGTGVIVGQELGRGNRDLAFRLAKKSLKVIWVFIIISTALLIVLRGSIVDIYDFEQSTNDLIMITILVFAFSLAPKMLAYFFICGIFRPGGDTVWCVWVDSGLNWLLQVPLAYIGVHVLHWEIWAVIALVTLGEVAKTIVCYIRLYSKKWINVVTGR
ncbi:MAG: MATE family efflux transporter [Firmicutes bacterium]|nr:MATE family efflux transporter [Bacillota bacterium]